MIIAFEGLGGYPGGRLFQALIEQGKPLSAFRYFSHNSPGMVSDDISNVVGFSYGAYQALNYARRNENITTLVTIDLRVPLFKHRDFTRPKHLKRWVNLYQHDWLHPINFFLPGTSCKEADLNVKLEYVYHWEMCEHPSVARTIGTLV
jgi:alpha/beta superfamily hydrolase